MLTAHVLVENTAPEGFTPEAALSFYIYYRGKKILLDAGASGKFAENAEKLGADIGEAEFAVLSHGHYDHGDGFRVFLEKNKTAKIYMRKTAEDEYYTLRDLSYKGINRDIFFGWPERFENAENLLEPAPGVWIIPGRSLENHGGDFFRLNEEGLLPDDFSHELSLGFELGEDNIALFSSCSHTGIARIVGDILEKFPGKRVSHVIGGFHLMGQSGTDSLGKTPEEVLALGEDLRRLGVREIYTGHCTGAPALEILENLLGNAVHRLETGFRIDIGD